MGDTNIICEILAAPKTVRSTEKLVNEKSKKEEKELEGTPKKDKPPAEEAKEITEEKTSLIEEKKKLVIEKIPVIETKPLKEEIKKVLENEMAKSAKPSTALKDNETLSERDEIFPVGADMEERPAAGGGGSSTRIVGRGRRQIAHDIAPEDASQQEIFSVRGTRSIKLSRHRDAVTVFPSGCMGVNDGDSEVTLATESAASSKEDATVATPEIVAVAPAVDANVDVAAAGSTGRVQHRPASAATRNPLTGVGYDDEDFIRPSHRRRDMNSAHGHGFKDDGGQRPGRIPPGGFSKGLW